MDFTIWKTITIGRHKDKKSLLSDLKTIGHVSYYAERILQTLPLADGEAGVDLIKTTANELGLEGYQSTAQIFKKAKELGMSLCPAEAGPLLRVAYQDQPLDEWLCIGMEPIPDYSGTLSVFRVGRGGGGLWLDHRWAEPAVHWYPEDEFLFCLHQLRLPAREARPRAHGRIRPRS